MSKLKLRAAISFSLVLFALGVTACGGADSAGGSPTPHGQEPVATAVRLPEESLYIVAMARDLGVGPSRLPLVVMLADLGQPRLDDRLASLTFSYRHRDDPELTALTDVQWRAWPVRGGVYVTHPVFDRAGVWEFRIELEDGDDSRTGRLFVQVNPMSSAPAVGDPAPVTQTRTARTVEEARQISSASNPDLAFYSISLDAALANGKPTVVLFSTPAYCITQTCGPQLETLGELKATYGGQMNFIHVELYENISEMLDTGDPSIGRVAEPVRDWGLITEPWTFFIDAHGVVTDRFEQFTTLPELQEAAERLLSED